MQELQETWVRSLGRKDPLEEGTILSWRMPWTEEPGGLQSAGLQRVKDDGRDKHMCQCSRKLLSLLGSSEIASLAAQTVKSACNAGDLFDPWLGKISWRREWLPTPVFLPGEPHEQRRQSMGS